MTDINRELAEDAAEDYSDDPVARREFVDGWLWFCEGNSILEPWISHPDNDFQAGYIAARDAPE